MKGSLGKVNRRVLRHSAIREKGVCVDVCMSECVYVFGKGGQRKASVALRADTVIAFSRKKSGIERERENKK